MERTGFKARKAEVPQWRRWCTVAAVASIFIACSLTDATSPALAVAHRPVSVVLFGDSLASQAAPYFDRLLDTAGATTDDHVFGGTAVCDWLPTMRRVAASHPEAAVLEFNGNTFTMCMKGFSAGSPSTVAKYRADMETAIALFIAAGTHVFLAGTPIDYWQWVAHDPRWADLDQAFAALAAEHPGTVTYTNAGTSVEGSDGAFVWTLPCLENEPCDGPTVDGVPSNVVRAPDGVHFCAPATIGQGCAGSYSSGAYRFAAAMAAPVMRAFHLGLLP